MSHHKVFTSVSAGGGCRAAMFVCRDAGRRRMSVSKFLLIWTACVLSCDLVSSPKLPQVEQVKVGDDATLQCRAPTASIERLEWNRPDLKPDKYVFFFRENRSYESYQLPSYRGRVKLRDPQMKNRDASVILRNVTINDTGTYECQIITGDSEHNSTFELKVVPGLSAGGDKDGGDKDGGDKDGIIAASLIGVGVVIVVVALIMRHVGKNKYKRAAGVDHQQL